MSAERMDRLERLFRAAQMHAPEDRAAFLDAACSDDDELRQELDHLLQADDKAEAEAFLEGRPSGLSALRGDGVGDLDEEEIDNRHIGPYFVQRRLGHGGMGDVYLAVRERPFKQYVALKIIRRGMDTREVVARFNVERQILAALNHPNVARLLDGGVTGDGLPYFAMEYVDGRPLTVYADEHRLTIQERLRLFLTVCKAVHYAHQNLVIHRDLKPSNILVTEDGRVKLLDFGIAKLLNPHLSPIAMPVTRTELRLMTPEYASPEQVRGEPLTTAADVYALGVILYELLTGHRPLRVAGRSAPEIVSVVCQQEPERPSTRVTKTERLKRTDGSEKVISPDTVSAARGMPVERLQRQIRGDLDNITLMALRKEPDRRYGSAEQLEQDIDRYLSGLPVRARPSTLGYRAKKFALRHRAGVVAAFMILCSLVGGLSAALWQAREAHQERDRAEQALTRSETVTNFLMDLFEANDPREKRGVEITARELLERGEARAEELQEQPDVQAHLLDVIGRVYESLGQFEPAENQLRRALRLRRNVLGDKHLLVAETMAHLASVLTHRGRYEEADKLLVDALALQQELVDGPHPDVVNTLMQKAFVLPYMGQWKEAEETYREVLDMRRELVGNDHPLIARSMMYLGAVLRSEGLYDESEAFLRRALEMNQRLLGVDHMESTTSMFQLALLLRIKGAYDDAESLLRRAIDLRTNKDGESDPEVSSYMFELGEILQIEGDTPGAERMLRRALELRKHVLGDHPATGDGTLFLAIFLHDQGAWDEADSLYREALSIRQRLLGKEHQEVAVVLRHMGALDRDRGQFAEAESLLTAAYTMHLKVNGPDHHHVAETLEELALLYERMGEMEKAASHFQEALAIYRKSHADEHVEVQQILQHLARFYDKWGKPELAASYLELLIPPSE